MGDEKRENANEDGQEEIQPEAAASEPEPNKAESTEFPSLEK